MFVLIDVGCCMREMGAAVSALGMELQPVFPFISHTDGI